MHLIHAKRRFRHFSHRLRRDEPGEAPPFLDIFKRIAIVCNLAAERLIFIEAQNKNTVAVTQNIPAGPH